MSNDRQKIKSDNQSPSRGGQGIKEENKSLKYKTPLQERSEQQSRLAIESVLKSKYMKEMRPHTGKNIAPTAGLKGGKGLRSIHTKVHNTSAKARNRSLIDSQGLDNPVEQDLKGIGAGLNQPINERGSSPIARGRTSEKKKKSNPKKELRSQKTDSVLNGKPHSAISRKKKYANVPIQPTYGEMVRKLDNEWQKDLETGELPETPLFAMDYAKRLRFEELKKDRNDAMVNWKNKDVKGIKKNQYIKDIQRKNDKILTVVDKNSLEKREVYTDRFPLLNFRNRISKVCILVQMVCKAIITTSIFENASISVIIANSFSMMFDDPTRVEPDAFFEGLELTFLGLYTIEMVLKIVGMGFYFNENAYIKDSWNILDFVIVTTSLPDVFLSAGTVEIPIEEQELEGEVEESSINVGAFRAFRVLRPLKTISSVKGLKVLISALFSAIPLLQDTMVILMFFFIIMSIAGANLLGGLLKFRCISVQNGKGHPDEMLCGATQCPGGYFCGKTNQNPNYGVTNFDNVSYSMLAVFQSVTLEGWSDIQVMLQEAYTYAIFLYFVLIVFIGAFFLLNLTLAVINSKFTEAHNEQQEKDRALMLEKEGAMLHSEYETPLNQIDQMSIAQFITARIYAKKMIEFLRMRQEIKKIEHERMMKLKEKQKEMVANRPVSRLGSGTVADVSRSRSLQYIKMFAEDETSVQMMGSASASSLPAGAGSVSKIEKRSSGQALGNNNIIIEDEEEQVSDYSDHQQLDKDISNFLIDAKQKMVRQGQTSHKLDIPKRFSISKQTPLGAHDFSNVPVLSNRQEAGAPRMKGNIGFARRMSRQQDADLISQQESIHKFAAQFEIENVIPSAERRQELTMRNFYPSQASFELSADAGFEIHSDLGSGKYDDNLKNKTAAIQVIPGVDDEGAPSAKEFGVTSDSDFELEARNAGHASMILLNPPTTETSMANKRSFDLRKDVSRTFKKMLTTSHNYHDSSDRMDAPNGGVSDGKKSVMGQSTNLDGNSQLKLGDAEANETQISEKGSQKRKKISTALQKAMKNKVFKNEDELDPDGEYIDRDKANHILKTNKDDIRQLEEFISVKRPKDPFKDLDPLTQKVDISANVFYKGTSQLDIFQARSDKQTLMKPLLKNHFVQLPEKMREEIDPDFQDDGFVRSTFHPYQQKYQYEIRADTSDDVPLGEDESEDADMLQAQEQPYETVSRIAYGKMLNHIQILEAARRSDIMITSTLSFNLITKDKRLISTKVKQALLTHNKNSEDLIEYIDEKSAYMALEKSVKYESGLSREKANEFRTNYTKSAINKQEFKTRTLSKFKKEVMHMNQNRKKVFLKSKEVERQENLKHEQNKRASEKRGLPNFDMVQAHALIEGKFHEEEEEEGDHLCTDSHPVLHHTDETKEQRQLDRFQRAFEDIMNIDCSRKEDEINSLVRKEFNLPDRMGVYTVNFNAIRKDDASRKRKVQFWSGQDVLREKVDAAKSQAIADSLTANRVWPTGLTGLWKRIRFVLRLKVKSSLFDNLLTFAVLCNTITLSLTSANMTIEMEQSLENSNSVFTWIFIYEMFIKWIAVGIGKYFADAMNILDGFVVWLSIFELVFEQVSDGSANLSAFRTIRMLRTFRVFRVARLLRALQSMQTIMQVIGKSYKSFIYITALMFLFILIFSLLGMSVFGGAFNYVDGKPRGNYDQIGIAFITIFQILTMENWQAVLFDSMRSGIDPYLICVFYVLWIFVGNFILLNLFLAILLDSFLEEDEENDESTEEKEEKARRKRYLLEQKKKRMNANKVFMNAMVGDRKSNKVGAEYEEDLGELDVEDIIKIYKTQGIIKKSDKEKENQELYIGVTCKASFYVFTKQTPTRDFCYRLCKHPVWESIVLYLIMLSSCKLGTDTYFTAYAADSTIIIASNTCDKFFNFAFIVEMTVKLIAIGFVMDEGSYLRDSWNQLDFFIVFSSILDMSLDGFDVPALKILRMLRVLRPLRFVSHNYELKMVVVALMDSVGGIFNVLIVIMVVYLIFAIMGVNFFGGTFVHCSLDPYKLHTELECLRAGGQWETYDHNFDNVGYAFVTLYVVSSLEGWPDIMINSLDITKVNRGPIKEFNIKGMYFFVIFILIGSFFFLNFFIGVLFLKYNQAQKEENKGFTPKGLGWMDIQRLIVTAQPDYETTNVPVNKKRLWFHELVSSQRFDIVIMSCIMLNMIQMAFIMEGITAEFQYLLDATNWIFTAVFIFEAAFKIIAYGDTYLKLGWNKFDFFVVSSSIVDLLLESMDTESMEFLTVAPQLARVMRVLRVTRIIKLAGKQEGLQAIIQTIMFSIPSLGNVAILLGLIYFMFTIMGWFLFQTITQGDVINEFKNFGTFLDGFLLVFALSTGEDWNKVMFDCTRSKADGCIDGINCGSNVAFGYFTFLILVCSHVMLNLFVLVIIQQFEKYYLPKENMMKLFKNDLQSFMIVWKELTQDRYRCHKIKEKDLTQFFRRLGEFGDKETSLGFSNEFYDDGELKKHLLKMAINSESGYIYFNELLYRCMRKKYGNMKSNQRMLVFELRTQFQIFLMTREKQQKSQVVANDDIFNSIIKKENQYNPFLTIMNFKISCKTWLKAARHNIKNRKKIKQRELCMQAGSAHDYSTIVEADDKQKIVQVEIEVEILFSTTSEEETDVEGPDQNLGTSNGNTPNSRSNQHSVIGASLNNLNNFSPHGSKFCKKQGGDNLKKFERKMTKRFRTEMPPNTCLKTSKTLTREQLGLLSKSSKNYLLTKRRTFGKIE